MVFQVSSVLANIQDTNNCNLVPIQPKETYFGSKNAVTFKNHFKKNDHLNPRVCVYIYFL